MSTPITLTVPEKRGAEDAGRYFRYMAQFVGFTGEDAQAIAESRPVVEKHLAHIVAEFYDQLLRYPPTRKFFLKPDGALDEDYIELRMLHQTNFWLRSATGVYDDDYARYVDYVGRAHTSHGADPRIYIAERYVIGMVGFMQHALMQALDQELHTLDHERADRAVEGWNKLLMIILEMLSRAYGNEREAETFAALVPVDGALVAELADAAFAEARGARGTVTTVEVAAGRAAGIPEGERKIVQVGTRSIGVFHHGGRWYALENHCLHRGGPVATGKLEGNTLTCPWHGFQYDVRTGQMLVDPSSALPTFPVTLRDGEIFVHVPETAPATVSTGNVAGRAAAESPAATRAGQGAQDDAGQPAAAAAPIQQPAPGSLPHEFLAADLEPGETLLVRVNGQEVAVYNVGGTFYATQAACTHAGGPLQQGDLDGRTITCPWHGSRFDVTSGKVLHGPAARPLKTYRVTVNGEVARVAENS